VGFEGIAPPRIALVLAGAASLGAYQAGALAALVEGLGPLGTGDERNGPPRLAIDIMTGASSGALNALLAAHCLVHGRDAAAILRRAWIDEASLAALRNRRFDAPLSLDSLARAANRLIDTADPDAGRVPVPTGIDVELAVTSLRGFTAPVGDGEHCEPSYRGRRRFHIDAGTGHDELVEVVRAALASAANPLGFAPRFLHAQGTGTGASEAGWHTDGGLLDNTLQRALELANERRHGAPEDRMLIVLHPFTSRLPPEAGWRDPATVPTWATTLLRSLDIQQSQLFADDVQEVHAVNTRIEQLAELHEALAALDPTMLTSVLETLGLAAGVPDSDPAGTLVTEIARRAGVARKQRVHLAVISPDVLACPERAGPVLSGDQLAGLGGFASRQLRANDFDLGYRCTLDWLARDPLAVFPSLTDGARAEALRRATAAYRPAEGYLVTGGTTLRAIGPTALLRLLRTGLHTLGVLGREAVRGAPQEHSR
jgi:predicted acylesterase/phospholipase RssA